MSLVQVLHFRLNVKMLALKWKILVQHWSWINTHYIGRLFKIFRIKKGDTVRIAFFMHCQLNWKCNMAPLAGLEPATLRLTAECSTDWAKKACIRRRHILPGRDQPSTFCAVGLNDCVRDENRWIPYAMVAEIGWTFLAHSQLHSSIRFLNLLSLDANTLFVIKLSTY